VAGTRSRTQAKAWGRVAGQHEAGGLCLLCGVRPGWAGAPLSSFLTLLEYYGLQLHHLSSNTIALVAIFIHLYKMFVGVRPSVRLFRHFFALKAVS
jgi:hypothetical protein